MSSNTFLSLSMVQAVYLNEGAKLME